MHTVPGGQNPDWHSDNPSKHAAFWDYKDHQDRTIWLWSEIAKRYKDNSWVAGYNPINEPCDPEHYRLPAFYVRFEKAIREIDNKHILWLDGNTFAMEWKFFDPLVAGETKLPNCAYSLHDYALMGFPSGDRFVGSDEQKQRLERTFLRKADFMHKNKVAAWNGEVSFCIEGSIHSTHGANSFVQFGPVYENPALGTDATAINDARYNLLGSQLSLYDKYEISWSIWLYKDIGLQGMVYTDPKSKWMETIKPFLDKKHKCQLDAWGTYPSAEVAKVMDPLAAWVRSVSPAADDTCKLTLCLQIFCVKLD
jgi:hypothetical protein